MSSTAVSATHSSSAAALRPGWTPIPGRPAEPDADAAAWVRVRSALRAESGDHNFDAWLAPLGLVGCDGDRVNSGRALGLSRRLGEQQLCRQAAPPLGGAAPRYPPGQHHRACRLAPPPCRHPPRRCRCRACRSACRSRRATPLTASSSASRTNWPTTRPMPLPSRGRSASTRCSFTAPPGWARRT